MHVTAQDAITQKNVKNSFPRKAKCKKGAERSISNFPFAIRRRARICRAQTLLLALKHGLTIEMDR